MEDDTEAQTLTYYNHHASSFAAQTVNLNLTSVYERFLRHVPASGRFLDAGCGVGRDVLAFSQQGFEVVGFDGSRSMVELARSRVGNRATIHLMRFDEMAWCAEFDGIWSCASLLHVAASNFPGVAARFSAALHIGGAWYLSFKLGQGERMAGGRLFSDHTEASLRAALAELPLQLVDMWTSADLRPDRTAEHWVNAIAIRHR